MTASADNKHIAYRGLLLAFAMILSYVEAQIPFFFGIPGMKLGLANLAVLLALFLFGAGEAFTLNMIRIILSSFLFGNMSMLLYSAAGGLFSFAAMLFMKRQKVFSIVGISMGGGVFHNVGQLLTAFFVVRTGGIFYYMPVLLVAGVITGFVNGIAASAVLPYIKRIK